MIEQFQVLEFSPSGQIWLSLSMLDLSPDTDVTQGVRSRLLNCRTGHAYVLPGFSDSEKAENPLYSREKDILRLVGDGLLSKEISGRLAISVHTVHTHRQRILEKLNAGNSMEAVRYASRLGWLDE